MFEVPVFFHGKIVSLSCVAVSSTGHWFQDSLAPQVPAAKVLAEILLASFVNRFGKYTVR